MHGRAGGWKPLGREPHGFVIQRPQIYAPRADFLAPPNLRASAETLARCLGLPHPLLEQVGEGV